MTGRSQSPNKLSIDHSKYLMENNSASKNEMQSLSSPGYGLSKLQDVLNHLGQDKNDKAMKVAAKNKPELVARSHEDAQNKGNADASTNQNQSKTTFLGKASQNRPASATGLSPTLKVRKLQSQSL